MKRVFSFYADAGHGWLRVQKSILAELDIAEKISSFSYQRGDYAYLEEDVDLSLFLKAMRDRGIEPEFREYHSEYSRIRSFDHYRYKLPL
ncbi:hypothetical protein [Nitrosomonas mobilis]|jgi:hypothetical protein|uniref:Uncharacterized protein n=1 Tax=Nitrosomonas mobilis TaxID=51642 RepID=A0A1G5SDS8_9PROT|nr:hypothetical protein [Nitrosomonas mobilis]SCZ85010.1 conserved hypothetical protein [Nitrosomonas mobilis]